MLTCCYSKDRACDYLLLQTTVLGSEGLVAWRPSKVSGLDSSLGDVRKSEDLGNVGQTATAGPSTLCQRRVLFPKISPQSMAATPSNTSGTSSFRRFEITNVRRRKPPTQSSRIWLLRGVY